MLVEVRCNLPNSTVWDGSPAGPAEALSLVDNQKDCQFEVPFNTTGEELATVHKQIVEMQQAYVYELLDECKC